jgi:hypothetical protein
MCFSGEVIHMLNILSPIGALFTVTGLLLTGYGVTSNIPHADLDVWWGMVMLTFGILAFCGARWSEYAGRHQE